MTLKASMEEIQIIDLSAEADDDVDSKVTIAPLPKLKDALSSGSTDRSTESEIEDEKQGALNNDLNDDQDSDKEGSEWSLYEDMLVAAEEDDSSESPLAQSDTDACSQEEKEALRRQLREQGEDLFLQNTVQAGLFSRKRLCTAFVAPLPFWLEGAPDQAYEQLLSLCIHRELSRRIKLTQYNSIDDAIDLIKESKNIIVLTGAGVSMFCLTGVGLTDLEDRYRQAWAFPISVLKRQASMRALSISVSVILKKSLTSTSSKKTRASSIQLPVTSYRRRPNIRPRMASLDCYRTTTSYSQISRKTLTIWNNMLVSRKTS